MPANSSWNSSTVRWRSSSEFGSAWMPSRSASFRTGISSFFFFLACSYSFFNFSTSFARSLSSFFLSVKMPPSRRRCLSKSAYLSFSGCSLSKCAWTLILSLANFCPFSFISAANSRRLLFAVSRSLSYFGLALIGSCFFLSAMILFVWLILVSMFFLLSLASLSSFSRMRFCAISGLISATFSLAVASSASAALRDLSSSFFLACNFSSCFESPTTSFCALLKGSTFGSMV
mmetsp:Transcript_13462/g.31634  ORF Transcript_13462/g.31634 Transcript_13462/m.31634 type:complete len:232 (-) Transcript_13462:2079-2774(-)